VAWQCGYEYNASRIKDQVLKRFIPGFDHHLAYHTNAAHYALAYGAPKEDITVIYNTINEERIEPVPKQKARNMICASHPSIGNRKIVLFVGAILAEKRIEALVEAMAGLEDRKAVLVIIGDGPHMAKIRRRCEGREDVVLTGAIIEGVGQYFDAAEVYVLPGTGGLGINEAMAHGLPIISGYADGSADDLVLNGINGFRLQNGSGEEIREKIALILDNPELSERMGKQSREMITGKFAFREFVGRIVNAISALSNRGLHG
jgi:glycosyltransferase involved in cell wall biosynthesis